MRLVNAECCRFILSSRNLQPFLVQPNSASQQVLNNAASDDEWALVKSAPLVAKKQKTKKEKQQPVALASSASAAFSWEGITAAPENATSARVLSAGVPAARGIAGSEEVGAKVSWSFRDAIARIDATSTRREGSSLRDKIDRVVGRGVSSTFAAAAAATTAAVAPGDTGDDEEEGPILEIDDDSSVDLASAAARSKPFQSSSSRPD